MKSKNIITTAGVLLLAFALSNALLLDLQSFGLIESLSFGVTEFVKEVQYIVIFAVTFPLGYILLQKVGVKKPFLRVTVAIVSFAAVSFLSVSLEAVFGLIPPLTAMAAIWFFILFLGERLYGRRDPEEDSY